VVTPYLQPPSREYWGPSAWWPPCQLPRFVTLISRPSDQTPFQEWTQRLRVGRSLFQTTQQLTVEITSERCHLCLSSESLGSCHEGDQGEMMSGHS
jgi:hypothetical protein